MQSEETTSLDSNDGLIIKENPDGSMSMEWDENDPRYSMFNGMSKEELNLLISHGLQEIITREENDGII